MSESIPDTLLTSLHEKSQNNNPSLIFLLGYQITNGTLFYSRSPKWQQTQEKVSFRLGGLMNLSDLEKHCMASWFVNRIWSNYQKDNHLLRLNNNYVKPEELIFKSINETFRSNYRLNGDIDLMNMYYRWLRSLKHSGEILGSYFYYKELPIQLVRNTLVEYETEINRNRMHMDLGCVPKLQLTYPVSVSWVKSS